MLQLTGISFVPGIYAAKILSAYSEQNDIEWEGCKKRGDRTNNLFPSDALLLKNSAPEGKPAIDLQQSILLTSQHVFRIAVNALSSEYSLNMLSFQIS